MALAFFGVVGYMAYVLMGAPADTRQEEEALKEEALKYSGINPDEFRAFAREMKLAEDEKPREAAKHLYRALDHFENLGTHNHYDVQEEIHELAVKIAVLTERKILENALKMGINWTPRYLNNMHI
jgi:tetrahydrodipicolinate N-succinyltransferase